MIRAVRIVLACSAVFAFSSCVGTAHLQTARTTPKGETDLIGGIRLGDLQVDQISVVTMPVQVGVRHGITNQFDVGVSGTLFDAATVDGKYDFLPPRYPLAIAASLGASAMVVTGGTGTPAVGAPASLHVSYQFGEFTPYAALQLGAYWVRESTHPTPCTPSCNGTAPSQPEGLPWFGLGVLQASAGFELGLPQNPITLLFEYDYRHPVFGSLISSDFTDNQLLTFGFRFRR